MKNQKYEHIVYGASVNGVVKSLSLMNEGKSVLLLNKFGFTGGAITESLRLISKKEEFFKSDNSIKSQIYKQILDENYSILAETTSEFIINPEVVKMVLLKFIENSNLEHLFHIVPVSIKNNTIELIAKEGLISFEFDHFHDLSSEKVLSHLLTDENRIVKRYYNIIVTKPKNKSFLQFNKIIRDIELKDGRYFLSLGINKENEIEANHHAQIIADELSEYLDKSGNRIQLLPARIDEVII